MITQLPADVFNYLIRVFFPDDYKSQYSLARVCRALRDKLYAPYEAQILPNLTLKNVTPVGFSRAMALCPEDKRHWVYISTDESEEIRKLHWLYVRQPKGKNHPAVFARSAESLVLLVDKIVFPKPYIRDSRTGEYITPKEDSLRERYKKWYLIWKEQKEWSKAEIETARYGLARLLKAKGEK